MSADRPNFLPQKDTVATSREQILLINNQRFESGLGNNHLVFPPIPESLTSEVIRNLPEYNMGVVIFPDLRGIITPENLKTRTIPDFLDHIESQLPGLRHYESLTDTQKKDFSVGRNAGEGYWQSIKKRRVSFPDLSGGCFLMETIPKPTYNEHYPPSKITDILGLKDRFNITWEDINRAMNKKKEDILSVLKLHQGELLLPEVMEWVLSTYIFEDLAKTNTYEWTNTKYNRFNIYGESDRAVIGNSNDGGAANISWLNSGRWRSYLGFRLLVKLAA